MNHLKDVKESVKIKILTDQNFSTSTKTGIVLVDFWGSGCMPCKLMAPVMNELAEETNGRVTIAKLNVNESQGTASKFNVRSIPTLILFMNGKEIHRFIGFKSKETILREIERKSIN
jgi:thioredoxin 1